MRIVSFSRRASITMRPTARLARRDALGGRLDAVIDRVAQQVHERIGEPVEDRAVELELGAAQLHLDPHARALGDVARRARQRLEDAQQRRGAQLERAALQLADHAVHAVEALGERRVLARARRDACAPGSC